MIPAVRPWRVRFFRAGACVADLRVETVNRRFARWLALKEYPTGALIGTRCTVSRMATECQAAVPACNSADYSRMR